MLLPPLFAAYFLHLLLWYVAVMASYIVIKEVAGRRTALLSATIFGFYPYLWKAVGWDYVDGAGITYYLVAAACLTLASRDVQPRWLLVLSGAAGAAAVYSNIVSAFLLPFLLVVWIALRMSRGCAFSLARLLLWSGIGAVLLTVMFGFVNHALDGSYWFYLPSIHFVMVHKDLPSPYRSNDPAWILRAGWLISSAIALLVGLFACIRFRHPRDMRGRMAIALYANLLCCGAMMAYLDIRYTPVLEIFYYTSYLLAPTFLFLGSQFFAVPETLSEAKFRILMVCTVVGLSIVWWDRQGLAWLWLGKFKWVLPATLILMALCFAGRAIWPADVKSLSAAVLGACLLSFCTRAPINPLFSRGPGYCEATFLRVVESMESCEQMRRGRGSAFG